MKKQDAYQLGHTLKTHGLKGAVSVAFDLANPLDYIKSDTLFLDTETGLVPYFIETINANQGKAFIKFEDVETVESAKKLINLDMYIPLSDLPELEEGEFYYHEIIGFSILDEEKGKIGQVEEVIDLKSHAIMRTIHQGKEVLIPMHENVLLGADMEAKQLNITLPDGLLEIYLEE